jgi:hypothetical protein
VSIISTGGVTLGGQKGSIPVSIQNKLDYAVRVRIRLHVDEATRGAFSVLSGVRQENSDTAVSGVIVLPKGTQTTKKLQVRATGVGTTQLDLQLLTPDYQPLPGKVATMHVKATHFGTFALVIAAAALGIFMITSAGRAIRRGHTPGAGQQDGDGRGDRTDDGGGAGQKGLVSEDAPANSGGQAHEQAEEADNVVHDRARSEAAGTDQVLTEDADDYARVPGWAPRG